MKQFRQGNTRVSAHNINEPDDITIFDVRRYCSNTWIQKRKIPTFIKWLQAVYDEYQKEQKKGGGQ